MHPLLVLPAVVGAYYLLGILRLDKPATRRYTLPALPGPLSNLRIALRPGLCLSLGQYFPGGLELVTAPFPFDVTKNEPTPGTFLDVAPPHRIARTEAAEHATAEHTAFWDRKHRPTDAIPHFLDTQALATQIEELKPKLRALAWSSRALFFLWFVILPGVALALMATGPTAFSLNRILAALLTAHLLLTALHTQLFLRTHKTLRPKATAERRTAVLQHLISPADAMHATAKLSAKHLLAWHPLTASVALNRPSTDLAQRVGRQFLRTNDQVPEPIKETTLKSLKRLGLNPTEALAPPQQESASTHWCPLCHQQYKTTDTGHCVDCPDFKLQPYAPAKP